MKTTTKALKEWNVAVNALELGETIMLLRKGGIREQNNRFAVEENQVLLYPTFEHQKPNLLKPKYASQVETVASGWHPETVKISSFAEITDILPVKDKSLVGKLFPYHIWNEEFASDRLKFKPSQPLFVLLLRTYKLPQIKEIPYRQEYSGCRSWIDLGISIDISEISPVLSDKEYGEKVAEIHQFLQTFISG
jgi:hypothetical protein